MVKSIADIKEKNTESVEKQSGEYTRTRAAGKKTPRREVKMVTPDPMSEMTKNAKTALRTPDMVEESLLTEFPSWDIRGTDMFVEPTTTEDRTLFVTDASSMYCCQYVDQSLYDSRSRHIPLFLSP
jgi:phosphoserine aminotransferase